MIHRSPSSARILLLLATSMPTAACAVEHDPQLAGDWTETTPSATQTSPTVIAVDSRATFAADGSLTLRVARTYAASTPRDASCIETFRGTGVSWWTEGDRLRLSGTFTVTQERASCASASDNQPAAPAMDYNVIVPGPADDSMLTYRIDGNTLTLLQSTSPIRTYVRATP